MQFPWEFFSQVKSVIIRCFSWCNKSPGISFPSQNWPKFDFSVGVINPKRILFPSQNQPKSNFSVGVTNPRGIPIPKGINVLSEHLFNSQGNSNSHRISFPKSQSTKVCFSVGGLLVDFSCFSVLGPCTSFVTFLLHSCLLDLYVIQTNDLNCLCETSRQGRVRILRRS